MTTAHGPLDSELAPIYRALAGRVPVIAISHAQAARGARITLRRRGDVIAVALDPRTTAALIPYVGRRDTGPLQLGESPTRRSDRLTRFGADYVLKQISAEAGLARAISANTLRRRATSPAPTPMARRSSRSATASGTPTSARLAAISRRPRD